VTTRRLHGRSLVVPALLVSALVAQAGLASPARAAGQRYASPTGTGTACTSVAPCSLATAVNNASSSTEVILASGTYEMGGTGLANNQSSVNVHGVAGAPRPVINTSANTGLQLSGSSGVKVSDLTINHTGNTFGLNVFSSGITVQRVDVHSTGPVACFLGFSGLARDSLCATPADDGIALDDSWGGSSPDVTTGTLTLRNITAIAAGASSYGVRAEAGNYANLDVNARNVIAFGTKADFRAARSFFNSDGDISVNYSNYDTTSSSSGSASITSPGSLSNQKELPVFADPVMFHQALGSPTIDKGTTDGSVGTTDIDGDARSIGAAVDIGADEYVPDVTPPVVALDKKPKHKTKHRKAKFRFHASEPVIFYCALDQRPQVICTSPFKARVKKGKHTLVLQASDPTGNFAAPLTYTWKVKKKHHKRHRGR
jgi:hypothetical protein